MALSGSATVKVSLLLLIVGLIVFVIGFASPYWHDLEFKVTPSVVNRHYYEGHRHFGLWTHCTDYEKWDITATKRKVGREHVDECVAFLSERGRTIPSELRATQFFETVGLIGIVVTFALLMVTLCMKSCQERRILPIISSIVCLASAGSIILGAIIFGATDDYEDNLSWAFALAIVGGVIFIVTGIVVLVGAIVNK